jgi:guanosine-3',5'-bis(diphosphate) 3'-pyrophosphohydrolase
MSLAYEAMMFARHVHKDQKRKYTSEPYWGHLAEVAGIVVCAPDFHRAPDIDMVIAVAWLHDSAEDQGVTHRDLCVRFGSGVAEGVLWLSDMETGNRAERKATSRHRLSCAPDWIQTIKCADLISNTKSIVQHDPKFAVTYLEEKRLLLDVLTRADPRLRELAVGQATPATRATCGILAGEPEIVGTRCLDGGTCHHNCEIGCTRRAMGCGPLSASRLNDQWTGRTSE